MSIDTSLVRRWLDGAAIRLRGDTPDPPVNVRPILGKLGVRLEKNIVPPHWKGPRGKIQRIRSDYLIFINRTSPKPTRLTSSERFTIGHELAHILVDIRFDWKPVNRAEYHALEDACDQFAAKLLLPDDAILSAPPTTPFEVVHTVTGLGRKWRLPLAKVALRICDAHPKFGVLGGIVTENSRKQDVIAVNWARGAFSQIGVHGNAHIPFGGELCDTLRRSFVAGRGLEATIAGSRVELHGGRFGSYFVGAVEILQEVDRSGLNVVATGSDAIRGDTSDQ